MKAVLLSAGLGTRLKPITNTIPKPCVPILNIPHIYWNFLYLKRFGVREICVNTHHLPNIVTQTIEQRPSILGDLTIHIHHEADEILGTAGGIKGFDANLRDEACFITMNCDLLTDFNLMEAVMKLNQTGGASVLVGMDHPLLGTKYGPIHYNPLDQRLTGVPPMKIQEDAQHNPIHFTGIHAMSSRVLTYIPPKVPCDILQYTFHRMLQTHEKIFVHKMNSNWFETGTPEDYLTSQLDILKLIQNPTYDDILKSIFLDLNSAEEIVDNVFVGKECHIDPKATLIPPVCIGDEVKIEKGAIVGPFAIVGPRAHIGKESEIRRSLVMEDGRTSTKQVCDKTIVFKS